MTVFMVQLVPGATNWKRSGVSRTHDLIWTTCPEEIIAAFLPNRMRQTQLYYTVRQDRLDQNRLLMIDTNCIIELGPILLISTSSFLVLLCFDGQLQLLTSSYVS